MDFSKYHKEMRDADGEPLWWPGGPDGFPFRGARPPAAVKDNEYQDLKPNCKFRHRLFYLSDNSDAQAYQIIRDKCANGLFIAIDKERSWDEATKHYKVYLEWVEPAYEAQSAQATESRKDAIHELVNSSVDTTNLPLNKLAGVNKAVGW